MDLLIIAVAFAGGVGIGLALMPILALPVALRFYRQRMGYDARYFSRQLYRSQELVGGRELRRDYPVCAGSPDGSGEKQVPGEGVEEYTRRQGLDVARAFGWPGGAETKENQSTVVRVLGGEDRWRS